MAAYYQKINKYDGNPYKGTGDSSDWESGWDYACRKNTGQIAHSPMDNMFNSDAWVQAQRDERGLDDEDEIRENKKLKKKPLKEWPTMSKLTDDNFADDDLHIHNSEQTFFDKDDVQDAFLAILEETENEIAQQDNYTTDLRTSLADKVYRQTPDYLEAEKRFQLKYGTSVEEALQQFSTEGGDFDWDNRDKEIDNEDWVDPAGGIHSANEEDPAKMYESIELYEDDMGMISGMHGEDDFNNSIMQAIFDEHSNVIRNKDWNALRNIVKTQYPSLNPELIVQAFEDEPIDTDSEFLDEDCEYPSELGDTDETKHMTRKKINEGVGIGSTVHLNQDDSEGVNEGDYRVLSFENELGYKLKEVNTGEILYLDSAYLSNTDYWKNAPKTMSHSFNLKEDENIDLHEHWNDTVSKFTIPIDNDDENDESNKNEDMFDFSNDDFLIDDDEEQN